MATLQLIQVHTEDQAANIVEQALRIAQACDLDETWTLAIFNQAVALLSQRIPLQPMPSLDLAGLNLGPRL